VCTTCFAVISDAAGLDVCSTVTYNVSSGTLNPTIPKPMRNALHKFKTYLLTYLHSQVHNQLQKKLTEVVRYGRSKSFMVTEVKLVPIEKVRK